MATIAEVNWWRATEIPLTESDWRNIILYCSGSNEVWDWKNSIYFIRLGPPYQIAYDKDDSPLIYIGRGSIAQRWSSHRQWLEPLGRTLPNARYEVWAFDDARCIDIEANALNLFLDAYGRIPLANRNRPGSTKVKYVYDNMFTQVAAGDRRYWWSIRPTHPDVQEYYDRGRSKDD
ncbi:hypothetical protein [Undibacter mobilis]|uniref:hypothetical protein n=1 Tax=Undibacter mobilis TaxID=2292256 RepID=UPI0011C02D19|nr:hypothetical protein [Undibacter mobilis]